MLARTDHPPWITRSSKPPRVERRGGVTRIARFRATIRSSAECDPYGPFCDLDSDEPCETNCVGRASHGWSVDAVHGYSGSMLYSFPLRGHCSAKALSSAMDFANTSSTGVRVPTHCSWHLEPMGTLALGLLTGTSANLTRVRNLGEVG